MRFVTEILAHHIVTKSTPCPTPRHVHIVTESTSVPTLMQLYIVIHLKDEILPKKYLTFDICLAKKGVITPFGGRNYTL